VYHGSFNFDFVYGDEVDDDDAWPYVDRHEEWFIHVPESEQPGNRVLCPGWPADIWWLEVDSVWKDYLGATTLKLLGEDHCDGWLIDGCHPRFGYSDQFWPGDLGDYWRPKMQAMLETVSTRAAQHELAPYIFADVWDWWANDLDVEDYAACDGIYLSEFIISWWYPFDPYGIERLEVVLDKLLAWQAQGKLTILNRNVGEVIGDRLICLACFHLVRGPRTYQLTGGDLDGAAPRWWPEYDFASGAPLGPQPTSAADLIAYDVKPYYRRDFEHCFAIVVTDTADGVQLADNVGYEILWPSGGGDPVDEDGNTSGSWEWQPWDSHFSWGGYIAREAPAGPGSR
jgi:hypothetical protein